MHARANPIGYFASVAKQSGWDKKYNMTESRHFKFYKTLNKIGGTKLMDAFQSYRKKHGFGKAERKFKKLLGIKKKKWWKIALTVVAIIVVAVIAWYAAPAIVSAVSGLSATAVAASTTASLAVAAIQGAAVGAGMSASMTAIQGGSTSDILKAGLKGAVSGAISGALAFGVGELGQMVGEAWSSTGTMAGLSNTQEFLLEAGKPVVHGAVQGGVQELEGGSFKDGFIGSVASGVGGAVSVNGQTLGAFLGNHLGKFAGGLASSVLLGGTASALSGGKFANGAKSAAFSYLFNQAMHGAKRLASALERVHISRAMMEQTVAGRMLRTFAEGFNQRNINAGTAFATWDDQQIPNDPGANGRTVSNGKFGWKMDFTITGARLSTVAHEYQHATEHMATSHLGLHGKQKVNAVLPVYDAHDLTDPTGSAEWEFPSVRAANIVGFEYHISIGRPASTFRPNLGYGSIRIKLNNPYGQYNFTRLGLPNPPVR